MFIKNMLALVMIFALMINSFGQIVKTSAKPIENPTTDRVKIKVKKDGELTNQFGKKIDYRLFPFTTYDEAGKKAMKKGTAKERPQQMWIDKSLLNISVNPTKEPLKYRTYLEFMKAERCRKKTNLRHIRYTSKVATKTVPVIKYVTTTVICPDGTIKSTGNPNVCIQTNNSPINIGYSLITDTSSISAKSNTRIELPNYQLIVTANGKSSAPINVTVSNWVVDPNDTATLEGNTIVSTKSVNVKAAYNLNGNEILSAPLPITIVSAAEVAPSSFTEQVRSYLHSLDLWQTIGFIFLILLGIVIITAIYNRKKIRNWSKSPAARPRFTWFKKQWRLYRIRKQKKGNSTTDGSYQAP